jgi:hypothetical protein
VNDWLLGFEIDRREYAPGDDLTGWFRLGESDSGIVVPPDAVVEARWVTEGKGDEDTGVGAAAEFTARGGSLALPGRRQDFTLALPYTPWSYDGVIVKLRWEVRLTVTRPGRPAVHHAVGFRLGGASAPRP